MRGRRYANSSRGVFERWGFKLAGLAVAGGRPEEGRLPRTRLSPGPSPVPRNWERKQYPTRTGTDGVDWRVVSQKLPARWKSNGERPGPYSNAFQASLSDPAMKVSVSQPDRARTT